MAEGDVFVAYLHKREVTLKVESSPGNEPVTVSSTSSTEFALTPPDEDVTETVIANWEGLYSSIPKFLEATKRNRWPMPAALKVLNEVVDHNKQQVPAQTILFNIQKISAKVGRMKKMKSGIEGVDCSGTVHQFLEDEDPLFFSTRLYDVKCIPLYFAEVVQSSQPARVYRHSNTEEGVEEDSLQNLSTITIAEVTHGNRLVVRKLHTRDQLGPNFTVPLDANLKVAAIRLQQGHLLDRVSDQRCMKKSMSCPNLARIACQGDTFMNAHFEDHCEVARDGVQAGRQRDHDLEVCYSVDTLKLKQHRRCGNVAGAVDIPMSGTSDRLHVMTTDTDSDDDSDCEYMEDRMLTGAHQGRKVPLSCPGSLLQGHRKKRKPSACVEASLGYSPLAQARKEDTHFLPCSASQKFRSMRCRDTDARPTELELFHHVARRLGADWKRFAIYLGFEDVRIQQADSMQSFEQKANDILVAWLKGSGNKRKSWATILAALETAELSELAREIEGHIEGGSLYCSASTSQVRWL